MAYNATKKPVIAIVGPTASGKSELAVKVAKKFNGEIISADSRQVYKGLNIGSGKVKGKWGRSAIYLYKTVPHHCIDYVSPKKRYTVVDFQKCARRAIEGIRARGKIPFLVGGTGLYIDAALGAFSFPSVPPNPIVRKKLEKRSTENLFAELKKRDPRRAATIDPHNKRRLIRALEIITATKKPIPSPQQYIENVVLLIGIKKEKKELQKAIAQRVRAMLARGLVAETKKLRHQGLSWKRIADFGFEYRLPALFLRKKISRKELGMQLVKENWRYAKRQMTWWRRNKQIRWVTTTKHALLYIKNTTTR